MSLINYEYEDFSYKMSLIKYEKKVFAIDEPHKV